MKLLYSLIPLLALGCVIGWGFALTAAYWLALLDLTKAAQEVEQRRAQNA